MDNEYKYMRRIRITEEKNTRYNSIKISNAKEAYQAVKPCFSLETINLYEEFWAVYLNNYNQTIATAKIGEGGINGVVADIRKIFVIALEVQASGLIICHNHPSGQLEPSMADKNITSKIKSAGQVLDIKLLDHIIVTESDYYSFNNEGLI